MAYTTINKSTDYFNTKLYTGNGSTNAITGVGFQPDWVWVKNRDIGTDAPTIYDAVRGATKRLQTSSTGVESTKTNGLTAFGSDGYTAGSASAINANGSNIVSWNWKANNYGSGYGDNNTNGSINSNTSKSVTAGFSIVRYTGTGANATVGHGLGSVPKMIIVKNTTGSGWSWYTYHVSIGATKNLYLNNTDATVTSSDRWQDTTPTSSVFYLGSNGGVNGSGNTMIAYCFADVQGFSKFGSYTGNGNADGTFVYTGFKPAFVMVKKSSSTENWYIFDNKRSDFNLSDDALRANLNNAEISNWGVGFDFCSNGFKARATDGAINASGNSYIYMAFAEAPLVGSNNVPCTAR